MTEFNLSDKELKSLLQEDGLEEPSMGFNQSVISKIEAYEKTKVKPVRAPKWLIISMLVLFIGPAVYMLATNGFGLVKNLQSTELPALKLDLGISSTYVWISLLVILVIWMAVFFDKFLQKTSDSHR